jgi:prepilin-type N-terminal cleavage/methylation domain-containing protein
MSTHDRSQSGFTLVEALVAIVILAFGLIAISNLFLVAGSSNQSANHMSATTAEAIETLEALKAIPFGSLVVGGDLDNDLPAACQPDCIANPELCPTQCVTSGGYNFYRAVPGVGLVRTRWVIDNPIPGAGGAPVCWITVRSETTAPVVGLIRSRSEFTTFRTCTTTGCPLECL